MGSEVQEIRGWGKHSAELLWERFQALAEGVGQVPTAQCWCCQVVLGKVRSPVASVQCRAGCLLCAQLCTGAGGQHWDVLEQQELPSQGGTRWERARGMAGAHSRQRGANAALPKLPAPAHPHTRILCSFHVPVPPAAPRERDEPHGPGDSGRQNENN